MAEAIVGVLLVELARPLTKIIYGPCRNLLTYCCSLSGHDETRRRLPASEILINMCGKEDNIRDKISIRGMSSGLYNAAARGDLDYIRKNKNELSTTTACGNTVLQLYITAQTKETVDILVVQELLSLDPSFIVQTNVAEDTPLHIAARYGHARAAEAIIDFMKRHLQGSTSITTSSLEEMLQAINVAKDTALHEATRHGHVDMVIMLIKESKDISIVCGTNNAGETPLHLAARSGKPEIVEEILNVLEISPSRETTTVGQPQREQLTVKVDQEGWTPLHFAADCGHLSVVKLLLACDGSAAYVGNNNDCMTALHIAACKGHTDIVQELILNCPDCCEIVDLRGRSVLHFAMESGKAEVTNVILKNHPLVSNYNDCSEAKEILELHLKHNATSYHQFSDANYSQNEGREILTLNKEMQNKTNEDADRDGRMKKASEMHLVVATLVATVTFAAGIAVPGGFVQEGSSAGSPVLAKNAAFIVFVIADAVAMSFSSFSVLSLLYLAYNTPLMRALSNQAAPVTIIAIYAMVVAFLAGTYCILENSRGIAITACVVGSICFVVPLLSSYRDLAEQLENQRMMNSELGEAAV